MIIHNTERFCVHYAVFCLNHTTNFHWLSSCRSVKVTICNHQADNPLYVWPDVWSGDLQVRKSMVIRDIKCPYWDQVSLNNTNPTQPCRSISYQYVYIRSATFDLVNLCAFLRNCFLRISRRLSELICLYMYMVNNYNLYADNWGEILTEQCYE